MVERHCGEEGEDDEEGDHGLFLLSLSLSLRKAAAIRSEKVKSLTLRELR